MNHSVSPVAIARTPFMEKFAIPRQPMLAPAAIGNIELIPPYDDPLALEGLQQVSHVWLTFLFHQALTDQSEPPRLRVRPPRLGGNEKLGVFATRSTHRPNSIGQSLVEVVSVEGTVLTVAGIDLLNGTPVLDIKPYVPYADCIPAATNTIASAPPATIAVEWQDDVLQQAYDYQQANSNRSLVALVEQSLAQDPKPAYQTPSPERQYGVRFWNVDIGWCYPQADRILINQLKIIG